MRRCSPTTPAPPITANFDHDEIGDTLNRPDYLDLIRELTTALGGTQDARDALVSTLDVLRSQLGAAAGVAWERDPAGQWRLLQLRGDVAGREATLAGGPDTSAIPGRGVSPIERNHLDGADLLIPACGGIGAIRLAWLPRVDDDAVLWDFLDAVVDVAGPVVGRHADREAFHELERALGVGTWQWCMITDMVRLDAGMYRHLGVGRDEFDHTLAGYLARVHPDDRDDLLAHIEATLTGNGSWHVLHRLVGGDGTVRWIEGRGEVAFDDDGAAVRISGTSQDVTHRRELELELERAADRDDVTGAASRTAFQRNLEAAAAGNHAGGLVVALADVDGFRGINERHGWAVGDRVLREVARLLEQQSPGVVMVARLAADEFALLLEPRRGCEDLDALGARIAACVSDARSPDVDDVPLTMSVGVASNEAGIETSDELLRAASVAVRVAKNRGNAHSQVFDPIKHGEALERLAAEADLRRAIDDGGIDVAYQPILALGSGDIVGIEALARWERPGHGPVSPAVFVPMAERAGMIGELGAHVLATACAQLRAWQEEYPHTATWYVAVNLAATELDDPHLVETVEDALTRADLRHDRLALEVTEGALSHDIPGALARLFELRRRGVRISIDDFGTGYSSLARLRELPFDILKIDRSFIRGITSRHTPIPILQALFSMARSLNLDVVAEGVETPVQLAALLGQDCDFVQGFLFSQPIRPEELGHVIADEEGWDPPSIAATVPSPVTSRRLQRLIDDVTRTDRPTSAAVLEALLATVAQLTSLDSVYLTGIDLREGYQEILAAANTGTISIEPGARIPWDDTVCRRAIADDREVVEDVAAAYPQAQVAIDLGIRTYLGVELHGAKGELSGTLCGVTDTVSEISQETVETLHWVARLLSDRTVRDEPRQRVPT